jgi:hypothetical protein
MNTFLALALHFGVLFSELQLSHSVEFAPESLQLLVGLHFP